MPRWQPETIEKRFADRVERGPGCWIWTGDTSGRYGSLLLRKVKDGNRWRKIRIYAHRLSWQLHFGEIPAGLEVAHSCDNPLCVKPGHLFLSTHAGNQADMASKLRAEHGGDRHNARLTEAQARYILGSKTSGRALARKFGVSAQTVSDVRLRRTWKHLYELRADDPLALKGSKGTANASAKLKPRQVRAIRKRFDAGELPTVIAADYGITAVNVGLIGRRKSWRHIP